MLNCVRAYLIYCIDKRLSIIPRELSDDFNLIMVREDRADQGDTLMRNESVGDQLFPGWIFTAYEQVLTLTNK